MGRTCPVGMGPATPTPHLAGGARTVDGLWLSRHADRRRAGRCPGGRLALCRPVLHCGGGTLPPRRLAGATVYAAGEPGVGGYFCRHRPSATGHGNSDHDAWCTAVGSGQRFLARRLASRVCCPVVERLPGTDYCRRAPGVEPDTAAVLVPPWHVSAGGERLPGWTAAPPHGLCTWYACHRRRDGSHWRGGYCATIWLGARCGRRG